MKIYFTKEKGKGITGAQVLDNEGNIHELTTNGRKCGLWSNGQQIIGTCDFDLICTPATAKKRLKEQATFCYGDRWEYEKELEEMEETKEPLF